MQAVVLRKRHPVWKRAAVYRRADLLRECHADVPRAAAINLWTEDQYGPLRTVDAVGEAAQALGIGAQPMADRLTTAGPKAGFSQSSSGMDKKTGPDGG